MIENLFPFILPIHVGMAIGLVVLVVYADKLGISWMRGKTALLDEKKIKVLHRAVGVGLVGMIGTGAMLAYPYQSYLITLPAFQVKMFFVLVLIVNSFFIGKLMKIAIKHSFQSLSQKQKNTIYISGGVSTISWVIVIVAANLLGLS